MYEIDKNRKRESNNSQNNSINKNPKCMASLRVQKDITEDRLSTDIHVIFPNKENLLDIHATINVREGYYADGKFDFQLTVPEDYPFTPPKVKCLDTIFHPNIDANTGGVCLNILRLDWKPIFTLNHILFGILDMFMDPLYIDPLNNEAAELLKDHPDLFMEAVKLTMHGKKYKGVVYSYSYKDKK